MPEYYNVTTNLGDAEIANAIATNTKLNITHIAFGDGNGSVPTPDKARTSLVREVHRQAVTKYERHATNANWIVIETIIPSSIGGFWVREMGIIANGKLISHGSHAPFEKVADPSGVSEYRLRFTQNVTDGSVVEITLDESLIYASQAWVEENFIKRTEIVDNLITADPNKPLSANAGKSLQDGKLGKNDNAVSATKLQTARTIGGVSFNGTENINLPGVNAAGNQSTTGNAATATKLQTARTIAISGAVTGTATGFDGSANIAIATTAIDGSKISTGTIPAARIPTLNQSTTGNAASATKLATARTIALSGAVTGTATGFDGSTNIAIETTAIDGSKISSGTVPVAQLPAASTSAAGVVKLNNTLTSTSTSEALTAAQGKVLNDRFTNDFLNTKTETGYQKYPSGRLEQWARITASGSKKFTFPVAFGTRITDISVVYLSAVSDSGNTMNLHVDKNSISLTSLTVFAGTRASEQEVIIKVSGY